MKKKAEGWYTAKMGLMFAVLTPAEVVHILFQPFDGPVLLQD